MVMMSDDVCSDELLIYSMRGGFPIQGASCLTLVEMFPYDNVCKLSD